MFLKKISLINYKNFGQVDFEFDEKVNCFTGLNGVGKTNLLDAIYHLCYGRSYFNPISTQNIRHGTDFFVVEGRFERNEQIEKIICSFKKGQKKVIKRNGKNYDRLSEHLGLLPLVIISPADRDLISEGSDVRRKFLDSIISLSNRAYLQQLIRYNKVLAQRNALLKYFALNATFDGNNLGIYDEQLHLLSIDIFEARKGFIKDFNPLFEKHYAAIAPQLEEVSLTYESSLFSKPLAISLKEQLSKDRQLQYTSSGIHKDDLRFTIGQYPIKKYGSQGQQKSFLTALKLAQFALVKNNMQMSPILLMDDIFDKLDKERVSRIVSLVRGESYGQLFISDTNQKRMDKILKKIHPGYKMFQIENYVKAETHD